MNYGRNEYQEEATTTLPLADQLEATIKLLEDAGIKTLAEQQSADAKEIIEIRNHRQEVVGFICEEIVRNIKSGRIPYVTVQDEETRGWLKGVSEGTGPYQGVWDKFIIWARDQRLHIFFENSIVGGEDVTIVSARPLRGRGEKEVTYRNE